MNSEPSFNEAAVLRSALNDLTRFAPIYERYVDRIYAYCLRRVYSASDAEDLTSLIFTRAMMGLHDYRGGSVTAWLFRIAHNSVVNYYRDRRTHAPLADADVLAVEHSAAEDVMTADMQHAVRQLVMSLPQETQNLLSLRMSGLNSSEIGEVLGKSAGAVRTDLYRILKSLRSQFAREFES